MIQSFPTFMIAYEQQLCTLTSNGQDLDPTNWSIKIRKMGKLQHHRQNWYVQAIILCSIITAAIDGTSDWLGGP